MTGGDACQEPREHGELARQHRIHHAQLGAFQDLTRRADLIVLLGKALDFTTRWAAGSAFDPAVRLIAIDPEAALVERAAKEMDGRLALSCIADVRSAAETLIVQQVVEPDGSVDRKGLRARYATLRDSVVAENSSS